MKIRFALAKGILPYIATLSKDDWGRARGPWVRLPAKNWRDPVMIAHEEHHVAQWYAVIGGAVLIGTAGTVGAAKLALFEPAFAAVLVGVAALTLWNSNRLRFRREAAAYGESLRQIEAKGGDVETQANHYARILASHATYDLDEVSTVEARRMIDDRYERGGLF